MKNLIHISNSDLLSQSKALARKEREITLSILHHLSEVERRRLHLELGYKNLREFVIEELGYSYSAAGRRVDAMRVIQEVPEVEKAIATGDLTLSVVSQAQTFFRSEASSPEEKKEILAALEGKSQFEAQKIFVQLAPHFVPPERTKFLTEELTQLQLVLTQSQLAKLNRIRDLKAHALESPSTADLLDWMADFVLSKIDPALKSERIQNRLKNKQGGSDVIAETKDITKGSEEIVGQLGAITHKKTAAVKQRVTVTPASINPTSRYVSACDARLVHVRAEGRCEFVSPVTSRRCDARQFLQIDHKLAWAKGGTSEPSNLQLLCAEHNRHKAFREYGPAKMGRHLLRRTRTYNTLTPRRLVLA